MTDRTDEADAHGLMRCSFCDKSQLEVRKLVAGPGVTICDECVQVCVDIMSDERSGQPTPENWPPIGWPTSCNLCHMPVAREEAVSFDSRGVLCRGCVTRVQGAAATRVE